MNTDVKPETEAQPVATQQPLEQPQPLAAEEASACAAQTDQRRYRRWLFGGALVGVPLLLYGGWDWLLATGLATVLIALGPCLAMCALGLCMKRGMSKSGASLAETRKTYETHTSEPPRG